MRRYEVLNTIKEVNELMDTMLHEKDRNKVDDLNDAIDSLLNAITYDNKSYKYNHFNVRLSNRTGHYYVVFD